MLERVEKYDILEEIGHGGMATVYRARDTRLNREVALKVMHPHLQGAREARARFEREAQTVARLRHRGLLDIYDYSGEDSTVSYIATELLTGPTLKRLAEEHPEIPAEIAACIVLQVAEALTAAHGAGVVHRDVKPENIMLHRGHVKLTDFGIAQLVDAQSMTTTGQVLGSPGHMAPEQIEGKDCTAQSDIFSLGTVLYLLAIGRLPFQGRNPHQVLKQIVEGDYPDPLRTRASVGGPLARIIDRCLATSLSERYASAGDLAADLTKFVAGAGIEDPDAALQAFLADPEGFGRRFRIDLIDRLIDAGERAQRSGRLPIALDHFNRVLALDDGNPRVLSALTRLGRRARLRSAAAWGGAVAVGLAVVVVALRVSPGPAAVPDPVPPVTVTGKAPAASEVSAPEGGAVPSPTPVRAPVDTTTHVASATNGRHAPAARPRSPARVGRTSPARSNSPASVPTGDSPRQVRFDPFPANVSISVDGGPPQPFGPSFREVSLSPGPHAFHFVGAHDCCEDLRFEEVIPPGPGVTTLERTLRFRPAGLYVVSDQPANVDVDEGAVSGRSRSVLRVPHENALQESHQVRVTAEGYAPFEAAVSLQAGQVKTLEVPLRPIEAQPVP